MTFQVSPSTYTDGGLYLPQIARTFSLLGQHKFASGMPSIACDHVSAHRHSSRNTCSGMPTVYHTVLDATHLDLIGGRPLLSLVPGT
jgi:hypothetical protein